MFHGRMQPSFQPADILWYVSREMREFFQYGRGKRSVSEKEWLLSLDSPFLPFTPLLCGTPATFIPPIIIYLETGEIAATVGSPWDCDCLALCKTDLEYYHQNGKPCNSKPPVVYGVGGSGSSVPRTCSGDSWASEIQLSLLNTISLTGWGNRSQGNPRKPGRPYYLAYSFLFY